MKITIIYLARVIERCKLLKSIDYKTLLLFSVVLGLAPFYPQPHIVEKIKMLIAGTLHRPIDIFDLFFHSAPIILLAIKFTSERFGKKGSS